MKLCKYRVAKDGEFQRHDTFTSEGLSPEAIVEKWNRIGKQSGWEFRVMAVYQLPHGSKLIGGTKAEGIRNIHSYEVA